MFDVNSKVCFLLVSLGKCMEGSMGLLQKGQMQTRTRGNISDRKISSVVVLLSSSSLALHV